MAAMLQDATPTVANPDTLVKSRSNKAVCGSKNVSSIVLTPMMEHAMKNKEKAR